MRDIFTDFFENEPLDPVQAARRAMRTLLRKRFYQRAQAAEFSEGGFAVLLDGKPVKTPARRLLAVPSLPLADRIAEEWNAQAEQIDPALMPLTRLANVVIDAVADKIGAVTTEIEKYLGSDLVCYRADAPAGLIARQARVWDPVLDWARAALGARFVSVEGIVFAAQPGEAVAAARTAIPTDPWRLAAVFSITKLSGSALLALAFAHGHLDADTVWAAAHVDEDWQMEQWGRDDIALAARAFYFAEFQAAQTVLRYA